ncbi:Thymidine kinase [Bacillus licheniformis]|uniref:thymidine kinase n=1 Tax=Bacillus licheniformis TaxID=1402 RepID=UPI0011A720F7|nr:thymidine kinase [Bacillus licheniformis]TWM32268.1 Thymidine kinase [Bacillus licheniformis]
MLTVITGGMFAEKSTELQRRGRRLERAGKKVGYFKPDFDDRYSVDEIVTHDGNKVPAINIPQNASLLITSRRYVDNYDVFCIDEVQFFNLNFVTAVETLLIKGKTVIVAGLDMDYKGHVFIKVASLMAMAEEVVKLHAVCASCGNDAWVSYRESDGHRLQLGTDEYTPLCRKCFYNKTQVTEEI